MFIFPTPLALCCCFTALACVAKLVAIKTPQRVRDKQVHLHLQVFNLNFLRHVGSAKRQKQGVGGDNLAFFLHRYTVNLNSTLSLQFISYFKFRQIKELSTPDYASG